MRDRASTYLICGGVPLYLGAFDDRRSIEDNIETQILDPFAPLHREPDFLLREELREVERYFGILLAVATGDGSPARIAARTGIDNRQLGYYLTQLHQLGYLERRAPLLPAGLRRRAVRHAIGDPLLRFWFRFLFPQLSTITQLGPRRAMRELIRPELPAYLGNCFEGLCREALPILLTQEGTTAGVSVGEYWDQSVQIDLVGLRDDNRIELGECKWGAVRSSRSLIDGLAARAASYPNPRNASIGLRVFTQHPVKPAACPPYPVVWTDLAALYGEGPD